MRRPHRAIFAAAALIVSGCLPSPEEYRASDAAWCNSYGFTPGTDGYATCMMTRDRDRDSVARQVIRDSGRSIERSTQQPAAMPAVRRY